MAAGAELCSLTLDWWKPGEPLQIWWRSVPGYNLWFWVRGSQCACPYSFPPRRWTFPGEQALHRTQPIFTQGAISQSGNMLTLYEMMFNNLVERSGQRLAERLNCIDPDPLPCLQVFIFDSISAVLVFIRRWKDLWSWILLRGSKTSLCLTVDSSSLRQTLTQTLKIPSSLTTPSTRRSRVFSRRWIIHVIKLYFS